MRYLHIKAEIRFLFYPSVNISDNFWIMNLSLSSVFLNSVTKKMKRCRAVDGRSRLVQNLLSTRIIPILASNIT
jgi:hypothetical protein